MFKSLFPFELPWHSCEQSTLKWLFFGCDTHIQLLKMAFVPGSTQLILKKLSSQCCSCSTWHPAETNLPTLKHLQPGKASFSGLLRFVIYCFPPKYSSQTIRPKHTHLMSPKSFLFPAMATTMSSGPCSFNSFTHFFSVWKESWMIRSQICICVLLLGPKRYTTALVTTDSQV